MHLAAALGVVCVCVCVCVGSVSRGAELDCLRRAAVPPCSGGWTGSTLGRRATCDPPNLQQQQLPAAAAAGTAPLLCFSSRRSQLGYPLQNAVDRGLMEAVNTWGMPKEVFQALLEGFEWDSQ